MQTQDEAFHLTYCTNIHPGEGWDEVFAQIQKHVPPLKAQLAPDSPFGIGLHVANAAAETLSEPERLEAFRAWLDGHDCYVFTLNGFPYGDFHREVVKDDVYAPDWRQRKRVDYTRRLARLLAALLPEGMEGSISTSPLSYKPWLDEAGREETFRTGARHLAEIAVELARIEEETGKLIHLGLEPEPDCLIENTEETIRFFNEHLFPEGTSVANEATLRRHIGLCYDTCHFAVEYDDPKEALSRFEEEGIRISKVQLSAALQMDIAERSGKDVEASLRPFAESTYLHQVIERTSDGALHHYPDLPEALGSLEAGAAEEWRVHYHVPLFVERYGALRSTQKELLEALETVRERHLSRHLEIETYTWEVLPEDLQRDLTTSIGREFEWVLSQLE